MNLESKTRRWWIFGLGVLVVVVALVVWLLIAQRSVSVQVATVQTQTMKNQVFTSGTVRPINRQVVAFDQLPQPFDHFDVSVGQKVYKGETLITLQNSPQASTLMAAKQAYTSAVQTLAQAKAQYNAAAALMQAQLYPALVNSQSAVTQAKAQLASAQMAYQATLITADFDGFVLMENPMGIAPDGSSAPLLELVGAKTEVVVDVSEVDAVRLERGMSAQLTTDAYPRKTWTGHIAQIAAFAQQNNAGAGQVEVDIATPNSFPVHLGYEINVEIVSQTHTHVPVVPYNALVQQGVNYVVYVYNRGRVEQRSVTLGITGGSVVEVTKGLSAGVQIVENPPANLHSGEAVRTR